MLTRILILLLFVMALCVEAGERIAYGPSITDDASFRKIRDLGFNCYILKMSASPVNVGVITEKNGTLSVQPSPLILEKIEKAAKLAEKYGLKLLLSSSFNRYTLKSWQALGEYVPAVLEGPRAYLSRGRNLAPWPGDKKFWREYMKLEPMLAAELSRKYPSIVGFLFDLEMYAGKINWWYCASFDDASFALFGERNNDEKMKTVPMGKRYDYLLKRNLLHSYYEFLGGFPKSHAEYIARKVREINPDFCLGMYAFSVDWFHPQFACGLSEGMQNPVLIFSEEEYNSGMTPNVLSTLKFLKAKGFQFRYFPGLHITKHEPRNLMIQAFDMSKICGGYWLFSATSLFVPQDQLPAKDTAYRFPENISPENYFSALRQINEKIKNISGKENDFSCFSSLSKSEDDVLVTPDIFSLNTSMHSGIKVTSISQNTAVIAGKGFDGEKLFDGFNAVPGIVGWSYQTPVNNPRAGVVLKLQRAEHISRIALSVPRILSTNYRVMDDFEVKIELMIQGKWQCVSSSHSKDFIGKYADFNHQFFDVDCHLDTIHPIQYIRIVFSAEDAYEMMKRRIKTYDAVHFLLSEVCLWKRKMNGDNEKR